MAEASADLVDLFVIGGGINGCGIARDAAGRGLSVALAEQGDLAQATSSASTKLFHGGLRYLEFFEFRLVREALEERETLLKAMPHISWPMRFVLPYHPEMRFEKATPTSRLLTTVMPWMQGRRPAWLIRLGLFLYDTLGGRELLPATRTLDLRQDPAGRPLQDKFLKAYEYSDCWVQDSRLVVLNARDAEARGARIMTRTKVVSASREAGIWRITTQSADGLQEHRARALVNAAGPWVDQLIATVGVKAKHSIRLVRGSHIIVPKLYDHDRCYFFQGEDGRIIFAIPYEQEFTLIGTTDEDHAAPPEQAQCSEREQDYLCAFASNYFAQKVTRDMVVWTFSGVRPLYNDGASSATAATRDYVLAVDHAPGQAPLLSVFGGKITTYRRLAESAMLKLAPFFAGLKPAWTAGVPLAGAGFDPRETETRIAALLAEYPFLGQALAQRLFRHYGLESWEILGPAKCMEDLGRAFGGGLTEAETRWLIEREYARAAEDIIWRRTKLGLRMTKEEIADLVGYMAQTATNSR